MSKNAPSTNKKSRAKSSTPVDQFSAEIAIHKMRQAEIAMWMQALRKEIEQIPFYRRETLPHCDVESMTLDSKRNQLKVIINEWGATRSVLIHFVRTEPTNELQFTITCKCRQTTKCLHIWAALRKLIADFEDDDSELVDELVGQSIPAGMKVLGIIDHYLAARPEDQSQASGKSRLVWRIVFDPQKEIEIVPVEQLPRKDGGWTKGRVLGVHLVTQRDLSLLPADREIIRLLETIRYSYYRPDSLDVEPSDILVRLIGHPHVQLNDEQCNVVRGELGLVLVEAAPDWVLVPAINGRSLDLFTDVSVASNDSVVACDVPTKQVIVAAADPTLMHLVSNLVSRPATIPPHVQQEFLARLPALESKLPVALPETLKGETIPPAENLILKITRRAPEGAAVELQVQPAPAGPCFTPGEGPVDISGQRGQSRVSVCRNPGVERLKAQALVNELALNQYFQAAPFTWNVYSDNDLLELLERVKQRPEGDPRVEWSGESATPFTVLGEVSASTLRTEISDHHDWFGLSGTIEIAGHQFTLRDLLTAIRMGRKYLSLGPGLFATISEEFRERLTRISDFLHDNRGKLEFNSTAAPAVADLIDDHLTIASNRWKQMLEKLQSAHNLNPQVPATLTAQLRDYQVEGFKWLRRLAEWGVGGCLADDMGLGKTVQTLAVLLDRKSIGPALIVAPVSVGYNWQREVERFAPTLRPILYRDTDRDEFLSLLAPGDLVITSYSLLQRHSEELSQVQWGTLVLDEAQAIKNSQTKTAMAAREIKAEWRMALTGTPIENHLGELWSLFRAISPGLFGSWDRFRNVFADPIEKNGEAARRQALSQVIRPFVLRRTKSEVLKELPERTEIQLTAELSAEERRLYEDARLWAVTSLTEGSANVQKDQRFQVLAALTRLRQLSCHPRLVNKKWKGSSAKLDLFLETIDELRDNRHRALVFSQFTQHLALVREALDERKIPYQYLDGSTPVKQRQAAVDAFQNGEGDLFLISLKAGGTGLNLTAADYVVHLDPWWNPAVEDQATDRAHRMGQTRPVTVYRIVSKDTIEEQILKLHADKRGLVAGILEGSDAAAKLSTGELIDLIKAGGEAAARPVS